MPAGASIRHSPDFNISESFFPLTEVMTRLKLSIGSLCSWGIHNLVHTASAGRQVLVQDSLLLYIPLQDQ